MDVTGHQIAAAGLIAVAAFTPGPNNLIVLSHAARAGLRATMPAIAGVIAGSLVLLAVVAAGGAALFAAVPPLRLLVAAAGAVVLAAGGVAMMLRRPADPGAAPPIPARFAALLGLQLLNPKGWTMVVTAVSTLLGAGAAEGFARLAPLLVVIPAAGLLTWSAAGALFLRALRRSAWFDRVMGALLVASAALLLVRP
jgi:threonine/homoserine/homoserine lactone efflux protein